MGLSREMLHRRLRDVDFRIVNDMQCSTMHASAHRTRADAQQTVHAVTERSKAGDCWFYRVTYRIPTLLAPHSYSDPATQPVVVLVDLAHGGNYPYTPPESYVIGPTAPWSPHFHPGLPICFERPGRVWASDGSTTLGHLLQHVARLINFDEQIDDLSYFGYNEAATRYWRAVLRSGPITPRLTYPMMPAWFFGQLPTPAATASKVNVVASRRPPTDGTARSGDRYDP